MSWTAFHSRGETLRAVVDAANAAQDGILPMQVSGVAENFTDDLDLVGVLLLKWHARLSGNIERALMLEPMDLPAAVASAWRTTAEQLPGVRLVFDRCTQLPATPEMATAMQRAREQEWLRLAAASGLANDRGPLAVEAGRRVEVQAREGLALEPVVVSTPEPDVDPTPTELADGDTPAVETTTDEAPSESFVDRIKAALAA